MFTGGGRHRIRYVKIKKKEESIARKPLHCILDTILGFSIRDLVLKTPEDLEEFKKLLRDKIKELEEREAAEEKER